MKTQSVVGDDDRRDNATKTVTANYVDSRHRLPVERADA